MPNDKIHRIWPSLRFSAPSASALRSAFLTAVVLLTKAVGEGGSLRFNSGSEQFTPRISINFNVTGNLR
jgi:hypothetical protein